MEPRMGWELAIASLSLAFALGLIIAWVYSLTHAGLSYVRTFTQSLPLAGLVAAMIMLAIGDDVARGLGVVGALTIVRFRTTLKDSRDLMFVFASLAAGVACGVRSYAIALVGTTVFSVASFVLWRSDFGTHRQFDAVLRLRMVPGLMPFDTFEAILRRHSRHCVLLNIRQAGDQIQEHAYQIELTDTHAKAKLLSALEGVEGLSGVTLLMQDTGIEP